MFPGERDERPSRRLLTRLSISLTESGCNVSHEQWNILGLHIKGSWTSDWHHVILTKIYDPAGLRINTILLLSASPRVLCRFLHLTAVSERKRENEWPERVQKDIRLRCAMKTKAIITMNGTWSQGGCTFSCDHRQDESNFLIFTVKNGLKESGCRVKQPEDEVRMRMTC